MRIRRVRSSVGELSLSGLNPLVEGLDSSEDGIGVLRIVVA